ncbi:ABC transporter ATP-binding protein/permease [Patescibacteria group bacterium]|nr:ABC transporter ATP-binding protein/permease [Patescibacteria group bacterium]
MTRFRNILKNLYLLIGIAWEEDRALLTGYFLTAFISVILMFIVYFFYKVMIDQVFKDITSSQSTILFFVIIGYLMVDYLSRFVTNTLNSFYFEFLVRSKFQNVLTRKFMEKLAKLDFANLEDGKVRNLIAKVSDTFTWRIHANLQMVNAILFNLAAILVSFVVAYRLGYGYFIVLFVFATPLYFIRAKYGNIQWSIYSTQSDKINYLWYLRYLFTEFPTLSEIKIYGLKDYFLKKAKIIQNDIVDQYKKPIIKQTIVSSLVSLALPLIIFFALRSFTVDIINKKHTLGDFTFFLNILYTFVGQISGLLINFGVVYENNLYVDDFFKLQKLENKITEKKKALTLKSPPKEIEFVDVSFKYPDSDSFALKNVSLKIKKGEDIAIVGHNGAGKTTLIKLLFRFYDPTRGTILVDGKNLKDFDIDNWYKQLAVLFQDFAKYNLSLKENIELGKIDKKENIHDYLVQAQGKELFQLKKGADQILGSWFETGEEISIGQWQKVAIARALYRNASILILDEPTSNIDPQAEFEIFNNLKNLYRNKNLIFISHRFSTVRMADQIYVLEKGRLIEQGTHEELLKKNNLYAKFFNIQKKGYE